MIPSTSAITPNLYGDTVTITTTAPADTPHAIALLMTAQGAILDQSTGAIDFGSVLVSAPATQTFTVSNKGNAPATVSYAAAPSVYTVSPQAQVVGGGANYTATLHFAPTAQQQYPGTAQMTVDASTVLCAAVKPAITLSGQGALDAQVAPTSLDFGLVNCGATGTAKKFTLTNTSKASFTWGATLGTAYYTISPTSGSLAKGASVMITVTPVKIPVASATTADLYADTVKITTTPVLESPYLVSLHETAQGAILSFNPTSINFGNVKTNKATSTRGFSVVNDGNLAAPVTLMESGSQFSISATSGTANAGASLPVNATFAPTVTGVSNGSVSVTTTAIKCAPLPANMTLTGNGL
jgi:hypothetical protein